MDEAQDRLLRNKMREMVIGSASCTFEPSRLREEGRNETNLLSVLSHQPLQAVQHDVLVKQTSSVVADSLTDSAAFHQRCVAGEGENVVMELEGKGRENGHLGGPDRLSSSVIAPDLVFVGSLPMKLLNLRKERDWVNRAGVGVWIGGVGRKKLGGGREVGERGARDEDPAHVGHGPRAFWIRKDEVEREVRGRKREGYRS